MIEPIPVFIVECLRGQKVPKKAHETDACYDLSWHSDGLLSYTLQPHSTQTFITGLKFQILPGWMGDIRGRSGLTKKGILCNPGTIDAGFSGEVGVTLTNTTNKPYHLKPGDRIAQVLFKRLDEVLLIEGKVEGGDRGEKGFGSTGR